MFCFYLEFSLIIKFILFQLSIPGDQKSATVISNSLKHPPTVTSGTITPEILQSFQLSCMHYFDYKKVAEADHMTTVASSFQSPLVQQWYFANQNTLKGNSFNEFMVALRKRFLKSNWVDTIHSKLLCSY